MLSRVSKIGIVTSVALSLAACGGKSRIAGPPTSTPLATSIPTGALYPDSVARDSARYYVASLTPGAAYVVGIAGYEDVLEVGYFDGDNTFTTSLTATHGISPAWLNATPSKVNTYIRVSGSFLAGSMARFSVMVIPAATSFGTTSEGGPSAPVDVRPGVPFFGTVSTRSTSYYRVSGLSGAAPNSISLVGQYGASTLHVYPDATYSLENDCTLRVVVPLECRFSGGGTRWFTVECGPVNRDGSRYVLVAI